MSGRLSQSIFLKALSESRLKSEKKAMLKQTGSNTHKIISKAFPNYLF